MWTGVGRSRGLMDEPSLNLLMTMGDNNILVYGEWDIDRKSITTQVPWYMITIYFT